MVKGVVFSIFWQFFKITLVILEISMAYDISFYAFFPKNYDGNKDISFEDAPGLRGQFVHFLSQFYGTYEMGFVFIDITMACDLSFYCNKNNDV